MDPAPIFELIKTKRAIRDFRDEPLPEAVVQQILEAGRLSGSAKNMQPWHFVAVQNRETLKALSTCGQFSGHLAGAALGIALVTADPHMRLTVPFDLGRTTQNMMLTAWAHGVGSVMATMYRPDRARQILEIPDDYVVLWCISFGYPGGPPRKGGRRSETDVIHIEKW